MGKFYDGYVYVIRYIMTVRFFSFFIHLSLIIYTSILVLFFNVSLIRTNYQNSILQKILTLILDINVLLSLTYCTYQ